jgi:RNA polymerase sigma-70 factor (ECF subfamily)
MTPQPDETVSTGAPVRRRPPAAPLDLSEALVVQKAVRPPSAEDGLEQQLVERAVRGEHGAFSRLYQHHVDDVFNYVMFRVRDQGVAEDLTQDVFVNALGAISNLRETWRFRNWLLRIAHNRVANHWRSAGRAPSSVELEPDHEVALEESEKEVTETRLSAEEVLSASAKLTELQQQVIALRFVAGLSVAETAEAMDRSVGAVKNLQHNALASLRKRLAAEDTRA